MYTCTQKSIIIHTPAHMYPQTMDRLKILLTEEGINFTDATFNTEDGIRGLGEQPFVSKIVLMLILLSLSSLSQDCFIGRIHYGILPV